MRFTETVLQTYTYCVKGVDPPTPQQPPIPTPAPRSGPRAAKDPLSPLLPPLLPPCRAHLKPLHLS